MRRLPSLVGLAALISLIPGVVAARDTLRVTPTTSVDGTYVVAWTASSLLDRLLESTDNGKTWSHVSSRYNHRAYYGRPEGTYMYMVEHKLYDIGLDRYLPNGVSNQVSVSVSLRVPTDQYQIINPHQNSGSYYKTQTHVHTHVDIAGSYSFSPELTAWASSISDWQPHDKIVRLYRHNLCFDSIAVTDHGERTRYDCPNGMGCFLGKETTVDGMHHWVVLDKSMKNSDFPTSEEAARSINIHAHPGEYVLGPIAYGDTLQLYDGMEIKKAEHLKVFDWAVQLGWYTQHAYWGFSSDDYHPKSHGVNPFESFDYRFGGLRVGWNVVNASDNSADSIRDNIKLGNFFAVNLLSPFDSMHGAAASEPILDDDPSVPFMTVETDADGFIWVDTGGVSESISFVGAGGIDENGNWRRPVLQPDTLMSSAASYWVTGSEKYVQVVVRKFTRNRCSGNEDFVEIFSQPLLVYGMHPALVFSVASIGLL